MSSRFLLRPFDDADRPALERLGRETVEDGTVYPFESVAGVLDYFLSPAGHVVVAERDGQVVGAYVVKPVQPDRGSHVANAGYVVGEDARGRGLGQALGRHSIERARELGYRAMQFNFVVSTNAPAVRLWRRLGFEIVAELPEAFRHPQLGFTSVFVMFRQL